MSILINKDTRLLVQGLGKTGRFHAELSIAYGTKVVGAVHPSRGGEIEAFDGGVKVPIFRTVEEAMAATDANASVIFVPPVSTAIDAVVVTVKPNEAVAIPPSFCGRSNEAGPETLLQKRK